MKVIEAKRIEHVCALHDDATQQAMRPDLVWEATNKDGKNGWQFVEVACPWAWLDHEGETLEKEYKEKVGKCDQLRRGIKETHPRMGAV
jgi:hypothetical protein